MDWACMDVFEAKGSSHLLYSISQHAGKQHRDELWRSKILTVVGLMIVSLHRKTHQHSYIFPVFTALYPKLMR